MTDGIPSDDVPRGTPPGFLGIVESLRAKFVEVLCPRCKTKFPTRTDAPRDLCESCERGKALEAEAEKVLANVERWLPVWLEQAGLSRREVGARVDRIPAALMNRLRHPSLGLDRILTGGIPDVGFGISGPAGTGKTFALSALFGVNVLERWKRRAKLEGRHVMKPFLVWLRWPEMVNEMRLYSVRDGGLDEVARRMKRWSEVEALVIDDLGAERLRGEYSEDWVASQLDLLVDRRYNGMRPTWWTTNLSLDAFVNRYGARLVSRLTAGTQFISYGAKDDLRVTNGGAGC